MAGVGKSTIRPNLHSTLLEKYFMKYNHIVLFAILFFAAACRASNPTNQPSAQVPSLSPTAEKLQPTESSTNPTVEGKTPQGIIPNTAATQASSTPECTLPANLTPALTEGPYYSSGSPEMADLSVNLPGTKLVVTGYVFDQNCNPVPGAWLDFWQADSQGKYDNQGYILRGHQFTDQNGQYTLTTIVPGLYPGRTEHIHVKVKAPKGPELTTQLFFPGVNENSSDGIYDSALLLNITSDTSAEVQAAYNFIISTE
jgi:protocatechuate 3,4-dioxygenase beta subunit